MLNFWRRIFGFLHCKFLLVSMFCTIKDPFQIRFVHLYCNRFIGWNSVQSSKSSKYVPLWHVAHNLCFFPGGSTLSLSKILGGAELCLKLDQPLPSFLLKTDFPSKWTIKRCLCKQQCSQCERSGNYYARRGGVSLYACHFDNRFLQTNEKTVQKSLNVLFTCLGCPNFILILNMSHFNYQESRKPSLFEHWLYTAPRAPLLRPPFLKGRTSS